MRNFAGLRSVFEKVTASFERQLERIGAIDFQGLEIKSWNFSIQAPLLSQYRKKFDHILVDEFQDTNDVQTGVDSQAL